MNPVRLTFIQAEAMCMFCDDPQGKTQTYTVYNELKMGYISCMRCEYLAKAAVKEWHATIAYGRANYLKDADNLKIKRSSGEIEDGWRIDNPFIGISRIDERETLHCSNKNNSMNKWCYVDDIIELNPPSEAAIKNLCVECGVDMGECNPRQFCGKTYCKN
jgi:hypothetical protein